MSATFRILGIAGSLRRGSHNQAALRAPNDSFRRILRSTSSA